MAPPLTEGILEQLLVVDPKDPIWESTPTLQLLSIKLVGSANTTPAPADGDRPDRYRIIISDGKHFLQAMLATQLNDMVQTNMIGKNTIATIEKMVCNTIGGKRYVAYRICRNKSSYLIKALSSSSVFVLRSNRR